MSYQYSTVTRKLKKCKSEYKSYTTKKIKGINFYLK